MIARSSSGYRKSTSLDRLLKLLGFSQSFRELNLDVSTEELLRLKGVYIRRLVCDVGKPTYSCVVDSTQLLLVIGEEYGKPLRIWMSRAVLF
jgi:hypothetical protein